MNRTRLVLLTIATLTVAWIPATSLGADAPAPGAISEERVLASSVSQAGAAVGWEQGDVITYPQEVWGTTAGAGSTPHAYVQTQLCTTDAECDDGQFCNGRERCDGNGQCAAGAPATCCSDPVYLDVCAEVFPRCDPASENAGAGCQSDADCKYGHCERCQPSCLFDADCNDGIRCNGAETCRRTCSGGPNNGNTCIGNSNCTPGTCIGQCQSGVSPCGGADCAERKCQNVVPTQYCHVDSDCPAGARCTDIVPNPPGVACFPRVCGDGMISGSEECDPNANLPNPMPGQLANGCFTGSTCLPDSDPQKCTCTAFCGNGNIETGEECDGFSRGVCPGWCGADCTCAPSSCGNGIVEPELGEECEADCDCFGIACRRPGDPIGECTCTCLIGDWIEGIDWDPSPTSPDRATRSLRFRVFGPVGCEPGWAIKVTMVELQNPIPPNAPCCPAQDFHTYESATCTTPGEAVPPDAQSQGGCARWVGKPGTFYETQGPPSAGPFRAARLQCTPFYWDWVTETATNPITVVGAEIMPSSKYRVQTYGASCKGSEATCTNVSAPVPMFTRRSGDVAAVYNPPGITTQPDAIDVTQLVNKFKSVAGAPPKAEAQLQPNLPELNADINALDIVAAVDAVKGFAYSLGGPCPCPSAVTCGNLPCPGGMGTCVGSALPGLGPGAMCVKTCSGSGDPCINNTHCPTGETCGNPSCRDRCGRCSP
jgi:hypothetical protein